MPNHGITDKDDILVRNDFLPVQLDVSRAAVTLFLDRGLAGTTVEDIAFGTGRSARTIWRYFGSKEGCAGPLLADTVSRFMTLLKRWPLALSIEQFLATLKHYEQTEQETADDVAALRLLALLPDQPALRAVWLSECSAAEGDFAPIVARRSGLAVDHFDVRLCAATTLAAMRLFHEEFGITLATGRDMPTGDATLERLGAAIRAASTLPICDPVSAAKS
jgi:AcrR family transcriptional regulator